jgi:hypothetical protein
MHLWRDVTAAKIIEFLKYYGFHPNAPEVNRHNLTSYISRQNTAGELVLWDVVIPRGNAQLAPFAWSKDIQSRKISRSKRGEDSIAVLTSPSDISDWKRMTGHAGDDPARGCLILYMIDLNSERGEKNALFRDYSMAEDVLGLAFIFPKSNSRLAVDYVSQQFVD